MSWRNVVWLVAGVAALAGACSSFDDAETASVDGGTGDGGTDDGSTSPDANGVSDADGGARCAAPKPSLCASGVLHLFDFGEAGAVPPNLFNKQVTEGSVEHVVDGDGFCTPGLVRATAKVPAGPGAYAEAMFRRDVNGTYQKARMAFAFRGAKALSSAYSNIGCSLVLRPATGQSPRTTLVLAFVQGKLSLIGSVRNADGGLDPSGVNSRVELDNAVSDLEAAEWHTIDANLAITTSKVTVSGTYDGNAFADFDAPLLAAPGGVSIECGILFADNAPATHEIDMDDVLIELCP